jgi:hypothetical protein
MPIEVTLPGGPGDLDEDGDVDLFDYAVFFSCVTAPGDPPEPDCSSADMDEDGDVDLLDFGVLQSLFTGSL